MQFNSVEPQEFFYISPLFLFSLLPPRWISWNLVVETNGSLKQMWQKKIHAYFSTSETWKRWMVLEEEKLRKDTYNTQLRSMTFHFWRIESSRILFFSPLKLLLGNILDWYFRDTLHEYIFPNFQAQRF